MKAPLKGKPRMAGILEKDPLTHRYFYIAKICQKIQRIELNNDGSITIGNTNSFGHEFDLTIPGKNSEVKIPWYIFQEEEYVGLKEVQEQSIFFECDDSGEITTPEKKTQLPISVKWSSWCCNDHLNLSDKNLQQLKGSVLVKINLPRQRFFFKKDEILLELRTINPPEFEGLLAFKTKDLDDQYPHCEQAVRTCIYAQFLDKRVSAVTKKENGDLYIDFDNKTTMFIIGEPIYGDFYLDDEESSWELINAGSGDWLSHYYEGKHRTEKLEKRIKIDMSESRLLVYLKKQVNLQNQMIEAMTQKFPVILNAEAIDYFPTRGRIECSDSAWEFRRNSRGFTFEDEKSKMELVIQMNLLNPNFLDAWRVYCFLNSVLKDKKIELSDVRGLLNKLTEKVDSPIHKNGKHYLWDEKKRNLGIKIGDFIVKKKRK